MNKDKKNKYKTRAAKELHISDNEGSWSPSDQWRIKNQVKIYKRENVLKNLVIIFFCLAILVVILLILKKFAVS